MKFTYWEAVTCSALGCLVGLLLSLFVSGGPRADLVISRIDTAPLLKRLDKLRSERDSARHGEAVAEYKYKACWVRVSKGHSNKPGCDCICMEPSFGFRGCKYLSSTGPMWVKYGPDYTFSRTVKEKDGKHLRISFYKCSGTEIAPWYKGRPWETSGHKVTR